MTHATHARHRPPEAAAVRKEQLVAVRDPQLWRRLPEPRDAEVVTTVLGA